MKTAMIPFSIGSDVACTDGECGQLTRVVIDPLARAVTDLVIEPKHRVGLARLVPINLVEGSGDEIRLKCSEAAFEQLEAAEETQYLPGLDAGLGYGHDQVWGLPYYGLVIGSEVGGDTPNAVEPIIRDRIPLGEIEVRRGEAVHATDGLIGKVQGVVIDLDHQVTHVLLQEGHLWGKKKVAIPISAITDVREGIRLSLTKDEVKDLPAVDIAQLIADED